MARKENNTGNSLIDWVRPTDADGPLIGAVFSTYALSLDQPDFFGQDFLPTMLGLGGARDRGYASPVTLDRVLASADVSLIVDAHALTSGMRPSLRVDVLPIGHKLQHAKLYLFHRRDRVRLIVASANLTHEGFRRQREIAIALDFYENGSIPGAILTRAVADWLSILKDDTDPRLRATLMRAAARAEELTSGSNDTNTSNVSVVFGGGATPLWQQLVDAWPAGEPILEWHICSPFWPQTEGSSGRTPFEAIAEALTAKGASLNECKMQIIARADSPGDHALPRFPFSLVRHLRDIGFPVKSGRIVAARLEASDEEIPAGMAAESRDLHAKWIVIAGPRSVIALVGSANFTRRGMGVLSNQANANLEAGVILTLSRTEWRPSAWLPPLQGQAIDWESCSAEDLREPPTEDEEVPDWPQFISRIELTINWERLPDPDGELQLYYRTDPNGSYRVEFLESSTPDQQLGPARSGINPNVAALQISAEQTRSVLARRVIRILWDEDRRNALFPVNVTVESKAGMPSVLGAKPTEEQLLAYFHGRISEEDLLSRLEQEAKTGSDAAPAPIVDVSRLRQLQSYIVRDFIESLFGLEQAIRDASFSPRAAELAFLGDLSPVGLAEQVVQAFTFGRRSATAAAFQLVEVIRVVGEVSWPTGTSNGVLAAMESVRERALERIFAMLRQISTGENFIDVFHDTQFAGFVRAVLPAHLAKRWRTLLSDGRGDEPVEAPVLLAPEQIEGALP
jgi:phosphatidylserine/phosphatidylglycerophosphate/cardiolipin synthase-like enzyme